MSSHVIIIYRSIACFADFDDSDLAILQEARRFNRGAGITGFLWRGDGQFFQALHGPTEVTTALIARIAKDDRHHSLEVFLQDAIAPQSPFADWTMGYDHFLEHDLELTMKEDGTKPPITPDKARDILAAMMRSFEEVRTYGSVFPYARRPSEDQNAYLARLERV